jgi:cobalt-zinc-cadmium efflux system protein
MLAEVAGAVLTESLALLSDAAHMFTDTMGLTIAMVAIRIGQKAADSRRTFGYRRIEILAAAYNALVLIAVGIYILYEGYRRFYEPVEVQSLQMIGIAAAGLVVNLIAARLLQSGKEPASTSKARTWRCGPTCLAQSASSLPEPPSISPAGRGSIPSLPSPSGYGAVRLSIGS